MGRAILEQEVAANERRGSMYENGNALLVQTTTLRNFFLRVVTEVFLNLTEVFLTLTEVLPCFSLSCKANARVKLAKTGHGLHSSTLAVICVVRLCVLFYVLFVCKCVLPPGDNPIAVNKYRVFQKEIYNF
jgi:hypothetical protein